MRKAIQNLDNVLALTITSKTVMPLITSTDKVFGNTVDVFATASLADLALLSSSLHQMWAIKYGYSMRKDPRYSPSDVFETFPRPVMIERLAVIGKTLNDERRAIMLRRARGLTDLYKLVNDPGTINADDSDVSLLREIHVELDRAVMDAYGWGDVPIEHGFHTYRQMMRWTVSPIARVEILDRLLEENHRRAAAQGEAPPPVDAEDEGDDE